MATSIEKKLKENIELWSSFQPKEAVMLNFIDSSEIKLVQTDQEYPNLRFGKEYLHDKNNPLKEAKEQLDILKSPDLELIYYYGIGLGYFYEAAGKWLKEDPKRMLVFLEDDLRMIHRFFETERASDLLHNSQIRLIYLQSLENTEKEVTHLCWDYFNKKLAVSALPHYEKQKPQQFLELHHLIVHEAALKNSTIEEYLSGGKGFFANFYTNTLSLDTALSGNHFFGKFKNIPAIICGAGPSLAKNLKQLSAFKDYALLFAGGSALNALHAHGIFPHFGAAIDPNPTQYERLKELREFHMPFFYRNRLYHKALKAIKGPKLFITGSGGYDIAGWLEQKLNISGPSIEEGHNVTNFCLEIAHAMGCNPIIFVGMDLAYTDLKRYAPGIVENPTLQEDEILKCDQFDKEAFQYPGIDGKPVYTLWKWIAESKWVGTFSKENPQIKVINATEGGIGFPGIENKTLHQTAEQFLTKKWSIEPQISSCLKGAKLPNGIKAKVEQYLDDLLKSLRECEDWLQILIEEEEELIKRNKKTTLTQQSGRAVLAETELVEQPAFHPILAVFNAVFSLLFRRELGEIKRYPNKKQNITRAHQIAKTKYALLKSVATLNISLLEKARTSDES